MKRFFLLATMALSALGVGLNDASSQTNGGWTLNINSTLPSPVAAGTEMSFDIRIDNNDNKATPASNISFTVPRSTIFQGITGLSDCTPLPSPDVLDQDLTVTCAVPVIPMNGKLDAVVNLTPMTEGVIDFGGKIDAPGPEQHRVVTIVRGADLSLQLQVPQAEVQAGSVAHFSALIKNDGPYPADSAKLLIPIPTGFSTQVTVPQGCSIIGTNISCDIVGPIAVGETRSLDFSSQVIAGNISTISIAGTVESGGPRDPDTLNNQSGVDLKILDGTDVSLQKTRSPQGLILLGDKIDFTLAPKYAGTAPKTATLVDIIPDQYDLDQIVAPPGSGWLCSSVSRTVTCNYDEARGSGYTTPILIKTTAAEISEPTIGITNSVTIDSPDETSGFTDNNTANDGGAHIVAPVVDLVAHKSGPRDGLVTVGNSYEFRLSTSNIGNTGFSGSLTITDHLPAGLTMTSISAPTGWVCTPSQNVVGPADISCETNNYTAISPLKPGQLTPNIVLTAEVTSAGAYANGMTVSFPDYLVEDANPGNNTVYVDGMAADNANWSDVSIIKSIVSPGNNVIAGEEIEFALEIVNTGPALATAIVVDDRLQDIVAAANGGQPAAIVPTIQPGLATGASCSVPPSSGYSRDMQCQIAELPICKPGEDCPIIKVKVRPGSEGAKTNTAHVFSTKVPDNDLTNNASSVSYNVTPRTDVTITKTSAAAALGARAGQELVYTITASVPANGLSDAEDVIVTDILPSDVYFVSATSSVGICNVRPASGALVGSSNNEIGCNLGRIENGSQQTVTVKVIPTTKLVDQTIINHASVTTATTEIDEDNNKTELPVTILPPQLDLIITKTDDPYDPVLKGDPTIYTITATNSGPSDAYNIEITDILPLAGFRAPILSTQSAGLDCTLRNTSQTAAGGTITCSAPLLKAGQSLLFKVQMESFERGTHTNNVRIESDETRAGYEGPIANNIDSETTTVRVRSDISVTKIPSVSAVDLRQGFSWDITVTSLKGPGLEVAADVTLVDVLPVGMELTALPIIVGNPAGTSCTGAVGGRNITCSLGDMEPGEVITVRLHTKITDVKAESASNTVDVETTSFDVNEANNKSIGKVTTVRGSTISGIIYKDFDGNDQQDTVDTGIGNVLITVDGISKHDDAPINRTLRTDTNGNYAFNELPPGTYRVFYSNVPEASRYEDGEALPGSSAEGQASRVSVAEIGNIVITADTPGLLHNFTRVPIPSIGLSKTVSSVSALPDGTFSVSYQFSAKNLSMEPLRGLTLTDLIDDANFGQHVEFSPAEGQYSIFSVSANGGSLNAGYNGASQPTILTNGTLLPNATIAATVTFSINPRKPWSEASLILTNQGSVEGTGEYSNKPVSDLSDKNAGSENTPEKNDPTTLVLAPKPKIELEKTGTPVRSSGTPQVGDQINYTFKITNRGDTPLFDVTLADLMPELLWDQQNPIARLEPNASNDSAYAAHYIVTQDDLDRGVIANSATTTGKWGIIDGEPQNVNATDDENIPALSEPELAIIKELVSSAVQDPRSELNDEIRYRFIVTNLGNTNLRDVNIIEALPDVVAAPGESFLIGALAPGASKTVEAIYKIKQADIDNGKVDNSATAAGIYGPNDGTSITTPPDTVTVPTYREPKLTLLKTLTSTVPNPAHEGDLLSWTVTATNEGNVTLSNIVVTDPLPQAIVTPANVPTLAPGDSATFTIEAPIQQAQLNAGQVLNMATAAFDDPTGPQDPVDSNEVDTPLAQVPAIALKKVADITGLSPSPQVDEEMRYALTIRNVGNVPLNGLVLTDDLADFELDAADLTTLATLVLQPQNADGTIVEALVQVTVYGRYRLKAEDIDAGKLVNVAHVTGTPTVGDPTPVTDTSGTEFDNQTPTETPLDRAPAVKLVKTITSADLSTPPMAGDTITYGFAIHNTGNVTLAKLRIEELVTDVAVENVTGWSGPLAAGAINDDAFTATYVLKQTDIDAGVFANSAQVYGSSVGGDQDDDVTDISGTDITNDTPTSQPIDTLPGLTIVKTAQPTLSTPAKPGDLITYSFLLTNSGNITLTDVVLSDPLPDLDLPVTTIATLLPGDANAVTLTGTYLITQADLDNGKVDNIASATGNDPKGDPVPADPSDATVSLPGEPRLTLLKTLTSTVPNPAHEGDRLSWTVTATNEGNVTLSNIVVTDPLPQAIVTPANVPTLAPGDSATFTIEAPIQQAQLNAGQVLNTATAAFDDPTGPQDPVDSNEVDTPLAQVPAIALKKAADITGLSPSPQVDEEMRYALTIRNVGNVPLNGIVLTDDLADFELDAADLTKLATLILQPQNADGTIAEALVQVTVYGRYRLKAEDIDAGKLVNVAHVSGTPTVGDPTPVTDTSGTEFDNQTPTETPLDRAPAVKLVKTITSADLSTPPMAGDTITYGFAIHNTGNVTLAKLRIEELVTDVAVENVTGWSGPLAAGAINDDAFTATYVLKQSDIDAGVFANSAQVYGSSVGGDQDDDVTDISGTDITNDTPTSQPIDTLPGLTIVKTAEPTLSTPAKPGDLITYSFLVTNTGNITLTDVVLSDPLPDLDLPVTTIATHLPGDANAVTLTGTYLITQADIQRGKVVNQAFVDGDFTNPDTGDKEPLTQVPSDEITVPLEQEPGIALVKQAQSNLNEPASAGEEIVYTFTVTNIGNLELTGVTIDDPLPGIVPASFNVGDLAPGEFKIFQGTYPITEDDIDAEQVINQAIAKGIYDDSTGPKEISDLSGPTNETDEPNIVPVVPPAPDLLIIKSGQWNDANGNAYPEPGELLEFSFTITNQGNAQLNNVTPKDAGPLFNGRAGSNRLSPFTPDPVTLMPGEKQVFTANYALSQEDIDATAGLMDSLVNTATAIGNLRNQKPYESGESTAKINLPATEPTQVVITKQAILRQVKRGERVPYIIKVENTSSSNAGPVNVIDTMPSGFRFVEDSAVLNGTEVTPQVNGRRISFDNLQLGPNSIIEIRLDLLALSSAGPGEHVNIASVTDIHGKPVAKDAKAIVEIMAEPVFDCGDIVGTVFDDKNRNGYQDEGEPGLAGVRLATVKGWLITTDQYGRFHVPCAALPDQRIGSNFIMKLDTRTLPTGYRLTTENPRVVRLTAGKMSKLNFGAAIGRVVRLDLMSEAFEANRLQLLPQWADNLSQLVKILREEVSVLRLTYTGANKGEGDLAKQRMKEVRQRINQLWKREGGDYQLEIETRVEVGQ